MQTGQFLQADFFDNTGGLNISDTPWRVKDNQSTGGFNYDYIQTGGIVKTPGHVKVNTSADTQLKTLGQGLLNTAAGVKTIMRIAGTKFQAVDIDAPSFTNLTEDTATASSSFYSDSSVVQAVMNQFSTTTSDVLWAAGAGASAIYGAYSATKVTKNGSTTPTGSISTSVGGVGGSFSTTGTYFYAVAFRKASTQALSNAALDKSATISATTQKVTIDLTTITNNDTTRYDDIYIYRSAVGGASGFTTGDLIATIASTSTSYVDDGTFLATAQNVPRANSTILDNSELPSGTFKTLTVFKRRLVTANNMTLYISDLNKPESWPTTNFITLPNGGPIKGLAIIAFNTPTTTAIDEFLVIFQERKMWVVTGSTFSDFALKFIDEIGCPNQTLIVNANGFLSWIDYRGVYIWDGSGKPIYTSRPIEPFFQPDGDFNVNSLNLGVGQFFRKFNQIYWAVPHKSLGDQMAILKLDLRLTLPAVQDALNGRMMEGVFILDKTTFATYSFLAVLPPASTTEVMLSGDDSGFLRKMYSSLTPGEATSFTYQTKFLECGNSSMSKRYHKVIVWVDKIGDWKLYLDYWTNYRTANSEKSSLEAVIDPAQDGSNALWDIALWDVAQWDDFNINKRGLVYNLNGISNNAEGDCIKLQLRQEETDHPVTINGFSILYTPITMRK